MTVEEIFGQISAHMVEGLMIHSQLSDYYGFLGLKGYQKCHKYHFYLETENFRKLSHYFIKHYDKLIPEMQSNNPRIIPDSWYQYRRNEVNETTRKNAVQVGMERWISWEKQTKKLYERMYQELINMNEIASAMEIEEYIKDVDKELAYANEKYLELRAMDHDISSIVDKQEKLHKHYKKKIEEIKLC